jgi:hypothetical protein
MGISFVVRPVRQCLINRIDENFVFVRGYLTEFLK